MQKLSMTDAFMLSVENDKQKLQMASVSILAQPKKGQRSVTVEVLRDLVAKRIHLAPALLRKLVQVPLGLDHPYWIEDDALDLDYHVQTVALPTPGSDVEFAELVADLVTEPFDLTRPLWQLYAVTGLTNCRVAIVFKLHHAFVDGISGLELHSMLFDATPEGRNIPPPDKPLGEPEPTRNEMFARGLASLPFQYAAMLKSATSLPYLDQLMPFRVTPGIGRIAEIVRLGRSAEERAQLEGVKLRAPMTVLDQPVASAKRRWAFASVPLADAKRVKEKFGVSINDVVVATMAGVARDLLLEFDGLPDEPLVAMVPVSVRSDESGSGGNLVQAMLIELPTNEAAPKQRLLRTRDALVSAKDRHGAVPADAIQSANGLLMPALFVSASRAAVALTKLMGVTSNLVVSNVPGPPIPVYVAGTQVESFYPFGGVVEGFGFSTILFSYNGNLGLGFTIADGCPADPWRIADLYGRNHRQLLKLAP